MQTNIQHFFYHFYKFLFKNKLIISIIFFTSVFHPLIAQDIHYQLNDDSVIVRPDYRNHLNIPEYNPGLMPLNRQASSTGVWAELNPKVPRVDYIGVFFINKDTGWACGANGTIIKTTDGGEHWEWRELATTEVLKSIGSYDGQTVVVAGDNGVVMVSSDLGESWQTVSMSNNSNIWKIEFINSNLVWMVGENGGCFKSDDGGYNWQTIITPLGNLPHWDVSFLDENYGFICSDAGKIIRTTNGGNNWELLQAGDDNALYTIAVIDSLNISAGGVLVKFVQSSDGGNTWTQSMLQQDYPINKIVFANDSVGYATGLMAGKYRSTNKGKDWIYISPPLQIGEWNLDFVKGSIGFSVGYGLTITKTIDTGYSWTPTIINSGFTDVFFNDENNGWLTGADFYKKNLYKTNNGGISLLSVQNIDLMNPSVVHFFDETNGLIGGLDDRGGTTHTGFKFTSNAGTDWNESNIFGLQDYLGDINKIFFLDNTEIGWAITTRGGILNTTDGGINWYAQLNSLISTIFEGISFTDSLNGWTANLNKKPFKTTNGGNNWVEQQNLNFWHTRDVYFIDENIGWMIDEDYQALIQTMDGGSNWSNVINLPGFIYTSFQFFDKPNHWLVMGPNRFETTDAGQTWHDVTQNIPYFRKFNAITPGIGYAVGDLGLFIKYIDSSYIPVELIEFSVIPTDNYINIKWRTATETNNHGFEIERKSIDENWQKIGFVNGKGTTTELQSYSLVDENLTTGNYQYRLKQIDFDGTFIYSNIIDAKINYYTEFNLYQNYPNPFNSSTIIKYQIPQEGRVRINLYNILGEKIKTLFEGEKSAGTYKINFSSDELPSGNYFYSLEGNSFREVKKLTIIK